MKKIKTLVVILVLSFAIQNGKAQTISTYAGNGLTGYSGDGGQATTAELNGPFNLCVDNSGNLLIPDRNNERVRMVNASGIISTIAGNGVLGYSGDGGPATAAELYWPEDVATDVSGNLYITDHKNSVIRKVNTSGIITTIAGKGGVHGYSGDGGQATAAELYTPIALTVDASGNIYITDAANYVIRRINMSGYISTVAGNYALGSGYSGDGGQATAAQINWCAGIAVDSSGNLFIADWGNDCIREVNLSGIISTIAGNYSYGAGYSGDGGPATAAEMNLPNGLAFSGRNLLIAENNNNCLRTINLTTGIISTYAGNTFAGFSGDGGPATAAELNSANGVTVNSTGTVFITDGNNSRIREVIPANTVGINSINGATGSMYVYPNPTNQTIFIKFDKGINSGTVTINDVTGKNITSQKINTTQNTLQMDISNLANGMYFVTLENEGKKYVSKFIKE